MCGILGKINFGQTMCWDRRAFELALDLQSHRGPDGKGVTLDEHFILGHRRLSILDLNERSSQPMLSDANNYALVFNGEIYNFKELKRDLQNAGAQFRTTGDTEVLLQGLIHQGIEFIHKCIGMFAFCFVDRRNREAFVVRDRLGIKPLYFSENTDGLSFSSTIASLRKITNSEAQYSIEALSSYLSFRYPIGSRTFFSHIKSLEPGQYLHIKPSDTTIRQYWDPSPLIAEQADDKGEEYYLHSLRKLIDSSVKYRLIADVPVGAYLSGGVDSSGLVATMAGFSTKPVKTFTIGFEKEGFNEFSYAKEIAEQYQTEHREIVQHQGDYLRLMRRLIEFKGAPLAVPNEIPIWQLSSELKKHITVVLSGEGADELFMGYGRIFRSALDYRRFAPDYNWSSTTAKQVYLDKAEQKYGTKHFSSSSEHFNNIYAYTSLATKKELLSNDLPLEEIEVSLQQELAAQFATCPDTAYENKISYSFIKTHLPGLLQRLDNATMAASVEGRVPFVDHRIVELALTIPLKYKLKWNQGVLPRDYEHLLADEISETHDTPKHILKKAFSNKLSDNILYRKKLGFPVPLHEWFKGEMRGVAADLLLSDRAKQRGLYNFKNIERWLDSKDITVEHDKAMKLWMLINNEIFLRQYFD